MSMVHNASIKEAASAARGRRDEVEHFVREGMPHGFHFFPGMFKQGDEAFTAVARFLEQIGLA
jgi:acetyl esterase/lipase